MPQRRSHFPIPTSTPEIATPKKRGRPSLNNKTPISISRQSKRLKSSPAISTVSKTTPKKSPYFEHNTSSSEPESESEIEKEASGYEDEDDSASLVSSPPESAVDESESEEYASEDEDSKKKKKKRVKKVKVVRRVGTNGGASAPKSVDGGKGQELWRQGVKTKLEPGEAVFIALPKARAAGSTPYKSNTIRKLCFRFILFFLGHMDITVRFHPGVCDGGISNMIFKRRRLSIVLSFSLKYMMNLSDMRPFSFDFAFTIQRGKTDTKTFRPKHLPLPQRSTRQQRS